MVNRHGPQPIAILKFPSNSGLFGRPIQRKPALPSHLLPYKLDGRSLFVHKSKVLCQWQKQQRSDDLSCFRFRLSLYFFLIILSSHVHFSLFRYAVVTGANKGIGFEICRQLASNGIAVVLTARDEKRGIEAVEKLKSSGYDDVVFHQLDVAEPASISRLADFIASRFGKLDILV